MLFTAKIACLFDEAMLLTAIIDYICLFDKEMLLTVIIAYVGLMKKC